MEKVKKEGHILRKKIQIIHNEGEYAHEQRFDYTTFCWQGQVQRMVCHA
jgi:hypothetical protein